MSHHDASEPDDRAPEGRRSAEGGRRRRATRPAWDAATYGVPEDLRRSTRSSRDRASAPYPAYPPAPEHAYPPEPEHGYPPAPEHGYPPVDYSPSTPADYAPADARLDRYPQAPSYRPEPYRYEPEPPAYPVETAAPPVEEPFPPYEPYEPYEPYQPTAPHSGGDRHAVVDYPGGRDDQPGAPPPSGRRAGRNLPAAIGVGVLLGGAVLASLVLWRPAFLGVIAVFAAVGVWELVRAIRTTGARPPLIPLMVGAALMIGLAWWGRADALTFGLVVTVLAAMAWRLGDGVEGYGRDVTAATLVAVYVPFLVGFAALMAVPGDGVKRVLVTLALIVLSDTGGYVAGVLFGRHPMAPKVSPKKSWEGLGGSYVAAGVGGAIMLSTVFGVSVFFGALFGIAIATASTLGDLGESMIKRDLGVKDMSNLLPGHGGIMDRLDSIVVAAPTAYVLLLLLVPPV
jgi:phosphatidate cytidylyltransferase